MPCQTISLFALTRFNSFTEGFAETFMVAIHLGEQFRTQSGVGLSTLIK